MSREEAIKELTDLLPEEFLMDYADAIRMAIKALEQEQCGDCISREDALNEMRRYHDDCAKTSEYTRLGFETAMEVIKSLPPVTPMPRMGIDWITEETPPDADAYLVTWRHPLWDRTAFIGICEWDGERWLIEDMEQYKIYNNAALEILAWADPEPYMRWTV